MGKMVWLKLIRGTVLELPGLTDHGRQPLVFRSPSLTKRCVTQEVFNHAFVQRYIAQGMLVVDQTIAPAAVAVKPAPAAPAPAPAPVAIAPAEPPLPLATAVTLPAPVPEPEIVESAPLEVEEPVAAVEAEHVEVVSEGLSVSPTVADPSPEPLPYNGEMSKPSTDVPRRRRRG